jgi:hypothetical protein
MDGICIDMELLLVHEEDDDQKLGWAIGGLRQGGESKRVGPETAQDREGFLFFQNFFLILFSNSLLHF